MPQNPTPTSLKDFLDDNPLETPQPTSVAKTLQDFLSENPVPEVKTKPLSGGEIASRMVKGLGWGVMKGMLDLPSSIGDFLWKNVPGVQTLAAAHVPGTELLNAIPAYRAAAAKADVNTKELQSGILTPETESRLKRAGNLITATADPLNPNTLPVWAAGKAMEYARKGLANTPDVLGSLVGSLPAAAATYGGAGNAFGVGAAKNIAKRTALHLIASSSATAAQSYLVQLRDGESNWMNVVRDLGVNAAFETIGLHGLRNAWRNELGKEAAGVVESVAKGLGVPPEVAELKVTQVRGGGGVQEPQVAQAVVQEAKRNPKVAATPIAYHAKKALSEYWENVVPKNLVVDPTLGVGHGVSFDVIVNGKPAAKMQVQSSKTNPSRFADMTDKIAERVVQLTQQGAQVKFDNVRVANAGAWTRFVRRLKGEQAGFGKMDARKLTAFEEQLGSAPQNSLAETGTVPEPGTKLVVSEPGKPQRVVSSMAPKKIDADFVYHGTPANTRMFVQENGDLKFIPGTTNLEPDAPAGVWFSGSRDVAEFYGKNVFRVSRKALPKLKKYASKFSPPDEPERYMVHETTEPLTVPKGMWSVEGPNVPVKDMVSGKVDFVPTRNTRVWLFEKKAPVTLAAHSDGSERHFVVDVNHKAAMFEPIDSKEPYFRGGLFSEVDRDGDLSNGPRGFVHSDGSITLSVTKGERFETTLDTDPAVESGPQDRVGYRPLRESVYKTPAERYAHASKIGSPVEEFPRNVVIDRNTGKTRFIQIDATGAREKYSGFGAGFQPSRTRTSVYQGEPGRPGAFGKVDIRTHVSDRVSASPLEKPAEPEVTARMRRPGILSEPPSEEEGDRIFSRGSAGIPMERYAIDKAPLVNDPALVDAKKAAEILLTEKNVDPGTKVRVLVTDSIHASAHNAPFTWTLEDLAKAEPGLYDMPELHAAALQRGYTAIPDGEGVVLRDVVTGSETAFKHRLEAASFLGKQRVQPFGPRIEEQAEAALKLGWLRSFDGAIDGGNFAPREAQKLALDALVANRRAGVKVWVPSESAVEELEGRARSVAGRVKAEELSEEKARPIQEKLKGELEKKTGLQRALGELEKKLGYVKGTIRHLVLPEQQPGKQAVVIYNRDSVQQMIGAFGPQMKELLKVDVTNPETLIQGLANRPGGLEILQHPDTASGIVYSHLKSTNQRELMLAGQVVPDQLTARPYRVYDPAVKTHFLTGAGDRLDPDDYMRGVELADLVDVPEEHSFEGVDPHGPPPIMETPLTGKDGKDGSEIKWTTGLGAWLKTRLELFQKWERESGIPFYRIFLDLEQSRDSAVKEFSPFRTFLDRLRGQVRNKGDRTNIQLLTEAKLSGDASTETSLSGKMSAKHVGIADQLTGEWKKYLKGIGFTPEEISASFKDFSALRKKGGDFNAYVGSRPALPRMMEFLRRQMQQVNTPLKLTERETDFYSLGVRLSRLLAYEKHLTPNWNAAAKQMEDAARATNIPVDVFNNFRAYMHEVMHTPDDVHVASVRTMRLAWDKADAALRKMTRGRLSLGPGHSEEEAIDLFGALSSMGYAANLAWNPASIAQQYLQTLQTTLPALGGKYTKTGLKFAVRWLRDPKLQEDMAQRGIAGHSTMAQPLALFQDFVDSKGAMASETMRAVNKFVEKGSHAFQVGDDFNRVVAYMGKHQAVMDASAEYLKNKANPNAWQTFREKTRLDLQDEKNGPITLMVKEALDAGQAQRAAHIAADHFQKFTQFVYNRGNNPRVLDGTLGRFLGQYGTYPLAYGNYLWHIATAGEKKLTKNKINALASIIAVNTGMLTAMNVLFDADASKWTTWRSFWYRGGPYAELAQEMLYVASQYGAGRSDDPVASIYAGRIATQIPAQIVPGFAGVKHLGQAAVAMANGDWQGSARALLGLQPAEGSAPSGGMLR